MAREGIEKLLNITDRSYNVLYYIDFTYSTCALQLVQFATTIEITTTIEIIISIVVEYKFQT